MRLKRELLNEELRNLCSPLNVNKTTKSRRMRYAGHVACKREGVQDFGMTPRKTYTVVKALCYKPEGREFETR
jgi:hypothetical protein